MNIEQQVEKAIRTMLVACNDPGLTEWANAWLDGSDQSVDSISKINMTNVLECSESGELSGIGLTVSAAWHSAQSLTLSAEAVVQLEAQLERIK
jgi:hypothetical protein